MLTIIVPGVEGFDDENQEFVDAEDFELELEHSLVTLSKWEELFRKPFLTSEAKTTEEVFAYIKIMTQTPNVPPEVFLRLSEENVEQINEFLNAQMTATTFHDSGPSRASTEFITSELIYYWMTALNIPFECERWHLSRLITLIKVCNAKQEKPRKKSSQEIQTRTSDLNAQRKAQMGTKG